MEENTVIRGKKMVDYCNPEDFHGEHEYTVVIGLSEYRSLVESKERYWCERRMTGELKDKVDALAEKVEALESAIGQIKNDLLVHQLKELADTPNGSGK